MYNASTTWCHLQMMSDVAGRTDVKHAGSQKHEIEEKLFYVGCKRCSFCCFFLIESLIDSLTDLIFSQDARSHEIVKR